MCWGFIEEARRGNCHPRCVGSLYLEDFGVWLCAECPRELVLVVPHDSLCSGEGPLSLPRRLVVLILRSGHEQTLGENHNQGYGKGLYFVRT